MELVTLLQHRETLTEAGTDSPLMCLQMNFLVELHSSSFHWPCSYPTSSPQSSSLKLSGWPPIQFLAGGRRGDFLNFIYVNIFFSNTVTTSGVGGAMGRGGGTYERYS